MRGVLVVCVAAVVACGSSPSPAPAPPGNPAPPSTPSSPSTPSAPVTPDAPTPPPAEPAAAPPPVAVQPPPTSDVPSDLASAIVTRTSALPGLPRRVVVDGDGTAHVAGHLVSGHGPGPYPYAVFSSLVSPTGEVTTRGIDDLDAKQGVSDLGFDAQGGVVAACGNPKMPLDVVVRVADGSGEAWRVFAEGNVSAISVQPDGSSYALVDTYVAGGQANPSPSRLLRIGSTGRVEWTRGFAPAPDGRSTSPIAMATAPGGDLVVLGWDSADGAGRGSPFLATLAASGDVRTFATFDVPDDVLTDVSAATGGGAYAASYWNVQVSAGRYEQWASLASVAEDGTVRWRRVIGKMGFWPPSRVTVDADGSAWVASSGKLVAYRPDGTLAAAAAIPDAWAVQSIALRGATPTLAGVTSDPSVTSVSGPEPSLIGFVWQLAPLPAR